MDAHDGVHEREEVDEAHGLGRVGRVEAVEQIAEDDELGRLVQAADHHRHEGGGVHGDVLTRRVAEDVLRAARRLLVFDGRRHRCFTHLYAIRAFVQRFRTAVATCAVVADEVAVLEALLLRRFCTRIDMNQRSSGLSMQNAIDGRGTFIRQHGEQGKRPVARVHTAVDKSFGNQPRYGCKV